MNLEQAGRFLSALAGHDGEVTFQTFDDRPSKRPELARILHGSLETHAARLEELNRQGAGVFVTVNRTDLRGRREENVTAVRALFVDSDNGPLPAHIPLPAPSIVVNSRGGQHAYWLLSDEAPRDAFSDAQRRLAAALRTDPAVNDLPRVMRVPGFEHHKADPFAVTLAECHPDRRYQFWDLVRVLPSTEKPRPVPTTVPSARRPDEATAVRRARAWIERRDPAIQGQGGDAHTYATACALVNDFDLSDGDAIDLLREWNGCCVPPWSEAELLAKVAHARKYAKRAPGSKLLEQRPLHPVPREEPPSSDEPPPWCRQDDACPPQDDEEPPPIDDPQGADQRQEKLKTNDLARLLMRDERVVCNYDDNLYHYNGAFWRPITFDCLRAMLLRYDDHEYTTSRRRSEAAHYVEDCTRQHQPIEWNAVGATEVPFANGVLDYTTGELEPHRPEDFLDRVLPHDYVPGAECPRWRQALADWFGDDPDQAAKVAALQEFFGYVLMQHARYKKALVLYGESDTGKSQVAQVLRLLVGNRNTCQIGIDRMDDPKQLAPIMGKMLNLVTELPEDSLVADGGFKQLVSTQEPVQIDEKYKAQITYVPIAKHVFATNNLPAINDKTKGVFNRLLVIRFAHVIPKDQQDKELLAKLTEELPGITNWALDGARRLLAQRGEFTGINESAEIIAEYQLEQNPVRMFLDEAAMAYPEARVLFRVLCEAFNKWNTGSKPWSTRAVGGALSALGLRRVTLHGKRYVLGVQLKELTN